MLTNITKAVCSLITSKTWVRFYFYELNRAEYTQL